MNAPASTFPAPRVTPNLAHAFGGIWRLTFRRFLLPARWLTVAIGLVVLGVLCAAGPRWGRPEEFVGWMLNFYVTFLVPALAFMAAAGAIREEMKASAVDYVLSRPVPRPAFVAFKFVSHLACTQLDLLLAFGVVLGFAASHQVPNLPAVAAKLLFGQVMLVTAFSALGFLCGAITTRYVVVGLAYAGVIEAGVGQIPTQLSRLSMTHQMRELLTIMLGRVEAGAESPGLLATVAIVLLFSAVMVAATAVLFTIREFAGGSET